MKNHLPSRKIPWFLITVFVLLVTGILFAGFRFYQQQQNRIKSEAQNYLTAIADLKVNQITQWRRERIADGELLLNNLPLVRTVEAFLKSSDKPNRKQELLTVMKSFQIKIGYESSVLFDAKGRVRLAVSPYSDSVGTQAHSLFKEVLRRKKVILSDLHKSGPFPVVHMDLMVPLFSPDRHDSSVIGTIMLRIDPQVNLFQLIQTWPTPSRTSETLLLEQDGDSIVFLNELRHKKNTTLTFRLPISDEQLPASMAVRGITGVVEGIDYRGVPVLAAIRPIPDSPWYMNAKVDQDEIYTLLRSQIWIMNIGMLLLILSASGIIGFWWRNQLVKFYRERYSNELERQALVKHFDYIIKYANDSILLIDMNGKIVETNDQACRMYGYTREELCQLYIRDILSQQTRAQDEKQMKQVEERGGLLFETEYRRKDGTVFPAEVSERFIKIDETRFYQSIVRDITERKRTEESLRESEDRFRRLVGSVTDYIYTVKLESGRPVSIIHAPACVTVTGYTSNEYAADPELWSRMIFEEDKKDVTNLSDKLLSGFDVLPLEHRIVHKNGSLRWVKNTPVLKRNAKGVLIAYDGLIEDISMQKQADEVLRESEETAHTLLNAPSEAAYLLDTERRIIAVNEAAAKRLGKGCNELIGVCVDDLFPPALASSRKLFTDQVILSCKPVHFEDERLGIHLENSLYPITDAQGKVTKIAVFSRDITERIRSEETLRQSESLFKMLVESSPVAIAVFSGPSKKLDYVSERFAGLFGYDREDIPSMDAWWQLAYPVEEYRNQIVIKWCESLVEAQREGSVIEPLESVVTCQDGSSKYIESTFTSIGEDTLVFFTDLTQHRMAQEALRQTHVFNELLIQTMPFGMDIVDEQGNILFMSKVMKNMIRTDTTSACCWESYNDNKQMCKDCPMGKGIPFSKPGKIETTGIFDGKTYQISYVGMMYEGKKAMLEVFQDITEQKKLQQDLIQSQKLLSIGTMAGGIAHDFNNILAIILGYSSILHSIKDNPEKFSSGVTAIRQAVDRGAGLVRQILTFARKTDTSFEPLSLSELVKELVSMLEQTFPKIITFNTRMEKQLPYIKADQTQIHQALLNLCVNARDAMPQGGEISIVIEKVTGENLRVRFPSATNPWYISLSVSDTGIGMNEATRNQIFDPFFTTKDKGRGTGLGLSVVYGIIQAHHGFVNVESTLEHGTTFLLYFPVPQESSAAPESHEQVTDQISGGNETLLLVEDETLLLDMVQILLESNGYTVMTAKDGEEAVRVYQQHSHEIALVISDMGLPKLTGVSEFEQMKGINPAVKIIFASGYFEPDSKAKLENAGAKGFLQKPYVIEEVLSKIRKALDTN